ncbi:MAG: choice-of-anchor L domain-containing protein [Pseudomonadales bacterium]
MITPSSNANDLVGSLVGSGITVLGSPNYIGQENQSGGFSDGGDEATGVGFDTGIVLSTGDVADIAGPNGNSGSETRGLGNTGDDDINTPLGTAGDSDLDQLTGGFSTNDAAVLEFDFQFGDGSTGGDLFFSFVFASEEYIDFIDTNFNDVFGFFVDGVNVALVPGTNDAISINTVNDVANSAFYRNNVANTNSIPNLNLDLAFDGMTTVITAEALGLSAGAHTMKFAVADTSDGALDAAVFLQGGSFSTDPGTDPGPGPGPNPVPAPGTMALLGLGLLAARSARRKATK